jgi:hypothetical protein
MMLFPTGRSDDDINRVSVGLVLEYRTQLFFYVGNSLFVCTYVDAGIHNSWANAD